MRRLLNTIWLLALCPLLMLGQGLQRYEYWVDEDYSQRKAVNSSSGNITLTIDIGSQTAGLHYLNFRSQNTDGDWSFLNRYLFYVPDQLTPAASLTAYEYWIDDDYSTHRRVTSSSGNYTIVKKVDDLAVGLHYLNFRVRNSNGDWGSLSRYLFYIPDEDPDAADGPIVAYRYNFNQVATYVPIGEQMSYQMSDFVIEIPELAQIGNLEKGCKFTFNGETNMANLVREQLVTFALQFQKKSGGLSVPVTTSFTMSDELNRNILPLPLNDAVVYDKVHVGDFGAFRIDLKEEEALQIKATQPCTIQLYDDYGYVMTGLCWDVDPKHSAAFALPDGTYYGVVYNMVKNDEYPRDQLKVKLHVDGFVEPVHNSDDLQDFIDGIGDDNQGTEDGPVVVPVDEEGLLVNATTDIEGSLQLLIDGSSADGLLPVTFSGGSLNINSNDCSLRLNQVRLGGDTVNAPSLRASTTEGGINNSGVLGFSDSELAGGSYTINNLAGATLVLSGETVVSNSVGQIVNSGNVYIDGTVSVGDLQNKRGGRILVTGELTKDINVSIIDEADVEEGVAIILGAEGYELTAADASHIHLTLPDGYRSKYDSSAKGIVISAATVEPGDVNGDGVITTYDATMVIGYVLNGQDNGLDRQAADMNGDGVITTFDATQIIQLILNQ